MFSHFWLSAQADTTKVQDLNSVHIKVTTLQYLPNWIEKHSVSRKDIQELQPEDLGQLLQKFPGMSLKSYGGLGGLKTFSFRGLGSQHTANVMDGFTLQNNQTGQINLGQIQTSNIEYVTLGSQYMGIRTPVSSLLTTNQLSIGTFEGNPFFKETKIRANVKGGSFGQSDNYFAFHKGFKKWSYTLHGKYRRADGNYPYNLKIGEFNYEGIQENNQLQEWYSGASLFFRPNELAQPIRLIYRNLWINQGLPGAVVLYNNTNKQYLHTNQQALFLDWEQKWGFTEVRYYANYQYDEQQYIDSNYLNAIGYLKRDFFQNNGTIGWRFERKKFGELLQFYGGLEQQYAKLIMGGNKMTFPQRWSTLSNIGFAIDEKKYKLDMRIGNQLIVEEKSEMERLPIRNLWSPIISLEVKERGKKHWKSILSAGTTVRLPSFNELYYAQVGNKDLEPEKVRQYSGSTGISAYRGNWFYHSVVKLYHNQILNKIVTIPTKNLFIWSIQNIGKVNVSGVDLTQSISRAIGVNWKLDLVANYSFQYAIDRTQKNSPTYGHQIVYTPKNTGNIDFTMKRKKAGVRLSSSWVGSRYSLNENIQSNLLDPFVLLDLGFFQAFDLKIRNKVNFQFQIKNILDQNYTYIRSFVMPGRNYLITLSYEF